MRRRSHIFTLSDGGLGTKVPPIADSDDYRPMTCSEAILTLNSDIETAPNQLGVAPH